MLSKLKLEQNLEMNFQRQQEYDWQEPICWMKKIYYSSITFQLDIYPDRYTHHIEATHV